MWIGYTEMVLIFLNFGQIFELLRPKVDRLEPVVELYTQRYWKNRKSQNFKIVLNRRETDSRVSLAKIRGQKSLKFENDGMGTGLKIILSDTNRFHMCVGRMEKA